MMTKAINTGYIIKFPQNNYRKICLLIFVWTFFTIGLLAQGSYDLIIRNGRIIDGTGNPWFQSDIGIINGKIVSIKNLRNQQAKREIDAKGLYVTPGFIDLHSHADRAMTSEFVEARMAKSLTSQGLTTVLGGPDGRNTTWPLNKEIDALKSKGHGMNFILMVGHSTIRAEVMGDDYERFATQDEIEQMRNYLREGLELGAFGMGAGLEYRPARFSNTEELVALGEIISDYNGFYIAHQRNEAVMPLWQLPSTAKGWQTDGLQSLEETIQIARATGIRVVGSHHKSRGRSSFGRSAHDIQVINKARDEGLQVFIDVYPYETFGGGARPMIPKWSLVNKNVSITGGRDDPKWSEKDLFKNSRKNLRRNWSDPKKRKIIIRDISWIVDHNGGQDRVVVVDYPDSDFVGKTLEQIARDKNITFQEVVVHMALNGYKEVIGGAWTRGYGINDMDVTNYYKQDYTITSSDAAVSGVKDKEGFKSEPGAHPRHFGAFTRRIARYVKDLDITTLPFAIRSMTGLPASVVGLKDRGYLKENYAADITIINFQNIRDKATILKPDMLSEGIEYVIVNGEFTVDQGELTGNLPGVIIRNN
jgi:N-acyl-D-amino-acid deacylase